MFQELVGTSLVKTIGKRCRECRHRHILELGICSKILVRGFSQGGNLAHLHRFIRRNINKSSLLNLEHGTEQAGLTIYGSKVMLEGSVVMEKVVCDLPQKSVRSAWKMQLSDGRESVQDICISILDLCDKKSKARPLPFSFHESSMMPFAGGVSTMPKASCLLITKLWYRFPSSYQARKTSES